jgi:purine/pyrimidine-nucleoside phosphorylase
LLQKLNASLDILCEFQRLSGAMSNVPEQFVGVTAVTKANIYFNGSVVSHAILFPDGSKKTIGLIYSGKYHFNTDAAERMQIVSGNCEVTLDGTTAPHQYGQGGAFDVPAKSGFTIEVGQGICEYICSFLS